MTTERKTKTGGSGPAGQTSKPTLKTISVLSGLAVPTVSRALNDAPDIGTETKKLIRRIADEIGYVPNRAGVRLRTGRTNVISLVLSTEHDVMNHTARLISSIAGGLQNTQFHMIVTPYFPSDDPMKPIRYIVETGSADAVIFNQIGPKDRRVAYLMEHGFPFATHGRSIWADKHAYFDFDNGAFGEIAIRKLARRGRRKVLLIAPPLDQNYAQNFVEGVTSEARLGNIALRLSKRVNSDATSGEVKDSVRDILIEDPEIDGIVATSTASAMASVAALESLGKVLGQDIDVVSKEAIPFLNLFRPQMIAVSEDVKNAGEFLARAAIQAVRHPELPPMQGLEVPTDD